MRCSGRKWQIVVCTSQPLSLNSKYLGPSPPRSERLEPLVRLESRAGLDEDSQSVSCALHVDTPSTMRCGLNASRCNRASLRLLRPQTESSLPRRDDLYSWDQAHYHGVQGYNREALPFPLLRSPVRQRASLLQQKYLMDRISKASSPNPLFQMEGTP